MAYIFSNLHYVRSYDTLSLEAVSNAYQCASIITPKETKTASSVFFRINAIFGTPGTLRVGIQSTSSGNPSGTWLSYADVNAATNILTDATDSGINKITVPDILLTEGTQYAVVVIPFSGTWNSTNRITYPYAATGDVPSINSIPTPKYLSNQSLTNHDYYDNSFVAKVGSTWATVGYGVHNGVGYTDGTYYGNLMSRTDPISSTESSGIKFTTTHPISISGLSFFTAVSSTTNPLDDLRYSIIVDGTTVDTGVFMLKNHLSTTDLTWVSKTLTTPVVIESGKTVIIGLSSPNSTASFYRFYYSRAKSSAISQGGTNSYRVSGLTFGTENTTDTISCAIEGILILSKTHTIDAFIGVSRNFIEKSKAITRQPQYDIEIDWRLNGEPTNENDYVASFSVERTIEGPLGGISLAIADVILISKDDRFLPRRT